MTAAPTSAARPVTTPALCALQRLLHLHRLEDHDEVTLGDRVALGHGDLDDRALHGAGQGVAGAAAAWPFRAVRRGAGRGGPPAGAGRGRRRRGRRGARPPAACRPPRRRSWPAPRPLPRPASPAPATAAAANGGTVLAHSVSIHRVCTRNGSSTNAGSRTISAVERQRRRHALDDHLVESAAGPLQRLGPGLAGHDDLRQQRVEVAADDASRLDPGVHADAGTVRQAKARHRSGCREEAATRVLAVDAELDRVPARPRILGEPQLLAVGDAELLAHQVDAGRLLGDRVLDLQPGVDLQEGDGAVGSDEVLDRAGAVVAGLAADRPGGRVDRFPLGRR